MKEIDMDAFQAEWTKNYNGRYCKFSVKEKFNNRTKWCFIWQGVNCQFMGTELIHGVTVVTGYIDTPQFFAPKEFLEKFEFTNLNPYTMQQEEEGTYYAKILANLQKKIRMNAEQ